LVTPAPHATLQRFIFYI